MVNVKIEESTSKKKNQLVRHFVNNSLKIAIPIAYTGLSQASI